jgi:membrane protein implicated in regulation of membrane protease activity
METIPMKDLFTKITSGAAGFAVLFVGLAMAGLGLTVMAMFAMFALAAIGLALVVRPFMAATTSDSADKQPAAFRQNPATA